MSTVTAPTAPATTVAESGTGPSSRAARRVARLVVAAPAALVTAVLLHPQDTEDAGATLERVAGDDRGRWIFVHLLEPASWIAFAVVLVLVARMGRQLGHRLVHVPAAMAAIGATAISLIVYAHGDAYLFMTEPGMDRAAMEKLYTHYFEAMPLAGPLALLFQVGLLVLGIGLIRSRAVPRWAGALLAVTPPVMLASAAAPPAVGGVLIGLPLVAGVAGCARAIGRSVAR